VDNSRIEREKSVSGNGASVKNKVAVNREAANKADDKTPLVYQTSGGGYAAAFFYVQTRW